MRDAGLAETPDGEPVEEAIARQIALAVADAAAAPRAAVRRRRGRERLVLPARRLPAGAAAPLCALGGRARATAQELPAPRQLDRRRPRRQSQRHRRVAAAGARAGVGDGARILPRPGSRARRGAVHVGRAGPPHGRAASAGRALARRCAGASDEPYRRAISGIYARLAATYEAAIGRKPPRPSRLSAEPYATPADFAPNCRRSSQALACEGNGLLSNHAPLRRLIRAVETFGFHLATLDLRQNANVHERVVAELLATAGVEADYLRCRKRSASPCCGAS